MQARSSTILVAAWLICTVSSGSAQSRSAADSDLDRSIGHWVATGVSFQSGNTAHPFAVDLKRADSRLQITLPAELKLEGGPVYELARTSCGGGHAPPAGTQTVAHRGLPARVRRGTHAHGPRLPCHWRGLRASLVSWRHYRRVSWPSLDLDSGQLAWGRVIGTWLPNNRLKLAAPGSQGRIPFVTDNLVCRSLSAIR